MSNKIANLPWYDLSEVRLATNSLWDELARQFRRAGLLRVPGKLSRDVAYAQQWNSPEFLFGQACGYDVQIAYANHLQVVATPCYDAPGCEAACYSSYVVVQADSRFDTIEDLRDTRCVINTPTSHSGMNVLRALVAPLHCDGRFFSQVRVSGAHERSLRMIQRNVVDVAAIDCVTHELLARHRPEELEGTRVIHHTEHVPAPPYVTGAATSPEELAMMRDALVRALAEPTLSTAKERLLLLDVELLPTDAYTPIEQLETQACNNDYWEIPGPVAAAG